MINVAIIGECMIEISGTPFGQSLTQGYGGDTLNTAIYLKRLAPTINVQYVTALGTDNLSTELINIWQKNALDTQNILKFKDRSPGLYWILLSEDGERSFMYWRKQSAASQWLKHSLANDVLKKLLTSDWIYLSGISLAILDDDDKDLLLKFLADYKHSGGKIAFDSNYRPILWQSNEHARQYYSQILALTDLALLTDDDEAAIWGISKEALPHYMQTLPCPIKILKQGAEGATLFMNEAIETIPTTKIDTVVDSTAAGDSFNAGVLAGLLNGLSIIEACQLGHQVAGTVIQFKGAIIPEDALLHLH